MGVSTAFPRKSTREWHRSSWLLPGHRTANLCVHIWMMLILLEVSPTDYTQASQGLQDVVMTGDDPEVVAICP